MTYIARGEIISSERVRTHVRASQHWTGCGLRIADAGSVIHAGRLVVLVREAGGEPEGICRSCYRKWREDPLRTR